MNPHRPQKSCSRCRLVKPLTEFHRDSSKSDGVQSRCKACKREADTDSGYAQSYFASEPGIIRRLVNRHGYNEKAAVTLASRLFDPYERCAICGVPNRMLWLFHRRGWPFIFGSERHNRRLTVDHIIPGGPSTVENTRLLCFPCNTRRGPAIRSDATVLKWITRQYYRYFSRFELWWLHTSPGVGGTAKRGRKHEAQDGGGV